MKQKLEEPDRLAVGLLMHIIGYVKANPDQVRHLALGQGVDGGQILTIGIQGFEASDPTVYITQVSDTGEILHNA